jgi:hypothetical protein
MMVCIELVRCADSEESSEHELMSACVSSSDACSPTQREPSDAEEVPASPNLVECTPKAEIETAARVQCAATQRSLAIEVVIEGAGCVPAEAVGTEHGGTGCINSEPELVADPRPSYDVYHVDDALTKAPAGSESTGSGLRGTSDGSAYFSNLLELARAAEEQRQSQLRMPLKRPDARNLLVNIFILPAGLHGNDATPMSPAFHSRISISSCDLLRYSRLLLSTGSALLITPQRLSLAWCRHTERGPQLLTLDSNGSCERMVSALLRIGAFECDIHVHVGSIAHRGRGEDRAVASDRYRPVPAGPLGTVQTVRMYMPAEAVRDMVRCHTQGTVAGPASGPKAQQVCAIPEVFLEEYRHGDSSQSMHVLRSLHSGVVDCSESSQSGALRRRGKECNQCSAIVPTGFFCPGHVANWPNHVQCLVPGCNWHESTKSGNYNKHRHQVKHPSIKRRAAPLGLTLQLASMKSSQADAGLLIL